MATQGLYPAGLLLLLKSLDVTATTLKVMLLDATAAWNPDELVVSTELTAHELVTTDYVGGYGGAGRKTATITAQVNTTDNRVDIAIADLTWTSIGATVAGQTGAAALIYETGGSDATAVPIAFWKYTARWTNGGSCQLDFSDLASGGSIQLSCGPP